MQFSPDGSKLASASFDRKAIVWDLTTRAGHLTLEGHSRWVRAVQFSPDGSKLASESYDGKVIVWNLSTNSPIDVIDTECGVSDLAFSADGFYLKTNIGSFKLKVAVGGSRNEDACSVHLRVQKEWILQHRHKIIWLPSELRPDGPATEIRMVSGHSSDPGGPATAIRGDIMAFGHSSGIVTFWEISD